MIYCSKCHTFISNDSSNLPEYCPVCVPVADKRVVELLESILRELKGMGEDLDIIHGKHHF